MDSGGGSARSSWRRAALLASTALFLSACGTLHDGRRWSDDATLLPGPQRLWRAARNAALDPWTWTPLVGAGVVAAGGWDREISDWARRETPLFGSEKSATKAGGTLGSITRDAWIVSALVTPSGSDALPWLADKAKGLAVEWSATLATSGITSTLKSATARQRPNGANDRSMPSSATADAFAQNALVRRNLDACEAPTLIDVGARIGMGVASAGVAWSRVEAGAHHPTDVLVGAAVGNFVARFLHDAFLGLPETVQLEGLVDPVAREYGLGVTFRF